METHHPSYNQTWPHGYQPGQIPGPPPTPYPPLHPGPETSSHIPSHINPSLGMLGIISWAKHCGEHQFNQACSQ